MSAELVQQLTGALKGQGKDVTNAEVALAYMSIDVASITQQAESRVTWQAWDRTTPINGVDPEHFLARGDFANADAVYLIMVDGHTVYVQPHTREEGLNPILPEDVDQLAEEHAKEIGDGLVFDALVSALAASVPTSPEIADGRGAGRRGLPSGRQRLR